MRTFLPVVLFTILANCVLAQAPASSTWLDSNLPTETRVSALLAEMTLEEKAAQMIGVWQLKGKRLYNDQLELQLDSIAKYFSNGLGQVTRPSDAKSGLSDVNSGLTRAETVGLTNRIQKYFIEETRLGIPVFYHEESLHGFAAKGGTSYPQPIAFAGSFDTMMVRKIFTQMADELRSFGAHQVLTPVLDVCRDPRWGRVEETYGEDPFLIGEIGKAAVGGFQGKRDYDGADSDRVIATLKHLTGHGVPEGGNNIGPAFISRRQLREVFMYPFKEVISAEKPGSLMASYNEIDGVPSHANTWMLQDVLRGEMGFEGFVVSDYFALRELNIKEGTTGHRLARNAEEATVLGIKAGVNIELPDPDVYLSIPKVVRDGKVKESEIDELLRPMLAAKFEMGLFENPYTIAPSTTMIQDAPAKKALAKEAAAKSMVLLQNRNNILPFTSDLKIAAIGPNMDRELLGGYSGTPVDNVTVLEGLSMKFGARNVNYAQGCYITTTSGWSVDSVAFPTLAQDEQLMQEATAVAKTADVIVIAIGGNEQTSREAWGTNHLGDRTDLQLVGRQVEMIKRLSATGKPIVALVFGGRPLALQPVLEACDAVVQCWYLGQETGDAVASMLTGETNFSGKLAISFPRSVGHIPAYYSHKPSARRGYLNDETSALFPFGYGLSYASFSVSEPKLNKTQISNSEGFTVSVDVTNTSKVAGAEVVQVYVRDEFASVTRPVRELKGFARVELAPGQTKVVKIPVRSKDLGMYDINMNFVVEPGEFTIYAGTSSDLKDLKSTTLTVK